MTDDERIWTRLTPDVTDESDLAGLRAEVADPLWTLGRQWQVGEFQGEDGGSPVRVDAWVERDSVHRYDLGDGPVPYDPAEVPLETVVESEPVMTGDDRPDMGTAVEAGLQFIRLLSRHGHHPGGSEPTAADFDAGYHLDESDYESGVDVPESDEARRFELVVADRALDGYDIYRAIVEAIPGLPEANGPDDVSWPDASSLPVPGSAVDAAYRQAAADYIDWYGDQFDHPAGKGAWDESRLEYDFEVATGEGDTETVYAAAEYPGGRLDWSAFKPVPSASMTASESEASGSADGVTEQDLARHASVSYGADPESVSTGTDETAVRRPDVSRLPSPVRFPGMPASRWWELEDGSVNLFGTDVGPGDLGKEMLIDFAVTYGDDWASIPLETEIGTTQRVTALAVVDSFGAMEVAEPSLTAANREGLDADGSDPKRWKLFTKDLGSTHDEPGLFVPPTLGESFESDPIERVVFARDELANLAWAIEERVLDPYGIRIDMEEYADPTLQIVDVHPDEDPAGEYIAFENPGDEPIDVGNWTLLVERATGSGTTTETFTLGASSTDVTVEPGSRLRVIPHVGSDTSDELYWDWNDAGDESPLLETATKVVLRNGRGWPVGYRDLTGGVDRESSRPYRVASDVFDHWYPLKPLQNDPETFDEQDTKFALARLVDADVGTLPTPNGRILDAYVPESASDALTTIHDEELSRAGVAVTRSYQLSRWIDGGTHIWSARQSEPGFGQGTSGLRYDYLEAPDDE